MTPQTPSDAEARSRALEEPEPADALPGKAGTGRVLVVEHRGPIAAPGRNVEPTHRRVQALLTQGGVRVARSGWEALEILQRSSAPYRLMVLDEDAGSMDALDLVRLAQELNPRMPVIISSAMHPGAVMVPPEITESSTNAIPRHVVEAVLETLRFRPAADFEETMTSQEAPDGAR